MGIPTLADKIVQGAVVEILNSIYETDFMGFSYGSRPGRSAHQALQALQTVLQKGKGNWVLDADLSKFFDRIDHKELIRILHEKEVVNSFQAFKIRLNDNSKKGTHRDESYTSSTRFSRFQMP